MRQHCDTLGNLYGKDPDALYMQLKMFGSAYGHMQFRRFSDLAKFILTRLSEKDFGLLQFFTQIILILPFATADCERVFSKMNKIKRAERTRLQNILSDLLLLYDITPAEKATLDITDLAKKVLSQVWGYNKKDVLAPEIRSAVAENYARQFV